MENKTGILVLTSSYPTRKGDVNGGFIHELSRRLADDFHVFVLAPWSRGLSRRETIDNVTVYRHNQFFWHMELAYGSDILAKIKKNYFYLFVVPVFLLYQLFAIRRIVKKEKIRLIHAHWIIPQGFLAVIYKTLFNRNVKIVTTIHGADINSFDNYLGNLLKKFILKNIDELTVVSNAIKEKVINLGYNKNIYVYPMGVDTKLFTPDKKDETIKIKNKICGNFFLFVGSLIERKGIRYLIQAMPMVIKEFPDTKFVIIGDGNLKNEMVELTKKLKIAQNVIFTGSIPHDELPPYFATADLFILPSFSEGWPVVIMESISTGLPCIVSDIPVFTSLRNCDDFIFPVKQKNSDEITNKIIEIQGKINNEVSMKARAFAVNNFDWKIVADNYVRLLEKV